MHTDRRKDEPLEDALLHLLLGLHEVRFDVFHLGDQQQRFDFRHSVLQFVYLRHDLTFIDGYFFIGKVQQRTAEHRFPQWVVAGCNVDTIFMTKDNNARNVSSYRIVTSFEMFTLSKASRSTFRKTMLIRTWAYTHTAQDTMSTGLPLFTPKR